MITPLAGSKQSIVNIAERACCVSLSANRRWHAHDLSLGFGDVQPGQTATGRAWIACVTLDTPDDAIALAQRLGAISS